MAFDSCKFFFVLYTVPYISWFLSKVDKQFGTEELIFLEQYFGFFKILQKCWMAGVRRNAAESCYAGD